VTLANIFGEGFPERVTGVDLLESLASESAREGFNMFFLGAAKGVAEKTEQVLTKRYPGLKISGTFAGDGDLKGDHETLKKIGKKIDAGTFKFDPKAEDIHTNIQQELKKLIGSVADKLHTARSRNDLVVLDMRLYCLDQLIQISQLITDHDWL